MLLHRENREDQPSAHGLFLSQNVWLCLLLLLFHVPSDKPPEQAVKIATNFPSVPVVALDDKMHAFIALGLGVLPCQWCRTEVSCHCQHCSPGCILTFSCVIWALRQADNWEVTVVMSWQQRRSAVCEKKLQMQAWCSWILTHAVWWYTEFTLYGDWIVLLSWFRLGWPLIYALKCLFVAETLAS